MAEFLKIAEFAIKEYLPEDKVFVIKKLLETEEQYRMVLVVDEKTVNELTKTTGKKEEDNFLEYLNLVLNHKSKRIGFNKEIIIEVENFDEY